MHFQRAIETVVDLPRARAVRMRVIPVEPAAIANVECVIVALARRGEREAAAIVVRVDGKAMPVGDRRCVERVVQRYAQALATSHDERGIDEFTTTAAQRVRKG